MMASDLHYAAVHWPANAGGEHPDREAIYSLPGVYRGALLMCADSARYWYDEARERCPLVVWRAIPRQGKLPAQLGWDAHRVADEVLNLWDEQPHGGDEWFVPLNELQFSKESGETWRGYAYTAARLAMLRVELRSRLPSTVRLLFPPWVPSDEGDHLSEWQAEAALWDGICLHAYGAAETMRARFQSYRAAFPSLPILVGEHNANHEGHDEYASLEMWADIATTDENFLGATYYIWETNNAGEHDLSIWGNDARLALFQNPPVLVPIPDPIPPPEPPMPAVNDMPLGCDVSSYQGRPDWAAVAASGVQFAITKATEGVGYVNPTFAYNWAGIKANTMIRGAYHFGRPSVNGAIQEAEFFCNHVEAAGLDTGDLVFLDLEDTNASGDLGPWVLDWLHHVESRFGYKPMVYTGSWYSDPHGLGNYPEIGTYGLWIAAYQAQMPDPPAPWPVVAIWQWTDNLTVPGIVGSVDGDRYNGDIETLKLYGKPSSAPPIPEPVPPSHTYAVGEGLAAKMAALGDTPASDEEFLDLWSEAMGQSGVRYLYWKGTGEITMYPPAA